ncbi:Coq4 family protein [Sphingorhabdus sp. Alg239-R122]|uniref:Coq4 family protein n=1 Tax=Sphingorhabdus sp. Alg239-R122 TaxID=2305989 RepID=UPI0013D99023|nr:Coq4 family protein [Sphingorhabdus sp. Alg239-R122]
MTDLPLIHPDRPGARLRPVKAFQHFRKLVADKEDTEQVFHVTNYLRGKRYVKEAGAFLKTPLAKRLRESGEYLPNLLDDHDVLRKMPAGSLAHAYADFMEREGLSAAGLVAEQKSFAAKVTQYDDQLEWYNNRMRDTHDMFHIITGYGRDPLGELALLAFSYAQNKSLGFLFIAWLGAFEERRVAPKDTPIFRAIREGQRHGKLAQKIGHQDIVELLPLPLEDVRAKLGINSPDTYQAILKSYDEAGLDANHLLGEALAA